MRFREFYPQSDEPQAALVLPNHLGSSFESDFSDRAGELAESLGMLVLAYERPDTSQLRINFGLRGGLRASSYVQIAAQTGRELEARLETVGASDLQRILTGNSAAATDAVMVARSQTLQADYLIAADPAGIQELTRAKFRKQWILHQRVENRLKPTNPQQEVTHVSDVNSGIAGKAQLVKRFRADLALYENIWRSSIVLGALNDIAESEDFSDLATNVAFVEHSFTGSPEYIINLVNKLNDSQQRPITAAEFKATFMPTTYHSHFNDTQNYADFINRALAETRPSPTRKA